jgi:hypothetical protein
MASDSTEERKRTKTVTNIRARKNALATDGISAQNPTAQQQVIHHQASGGAFKRKERASWILP